MLNRSASFTMSTSVLKALPGKLDIKKHSASILHLPSHGQWADLTLQQDAPAHVRNNGGIPEVRLESLYTVNPLYNDNVCSKFSLTLK